MMHSLHHSSDRGGVFLYYCVIHFSQSECIERALLHCRAIDAALNLLDCYLYFLLLLPYSLLYFETI